MAAKNQDVDGAVWFRLLALDVVTDVLFGGGEGSQLLSAIKALSLDLKRRSSISEAKNGVPYETNAMPLTRPLERLCCAGNKPIHATTVMFSPC